MSPWRKACFVLTMYPSVHWRVAAHHQDLVSFAQEQVLGADTSLVAQPIHCLQGVTAVHR